MHGGTKISVRFPRHCTGAPSPPSGGEGRDEGAPPQTVTQRLAESPPHPAPLPLKGLKGERERARRATKGTR
jgi:hypothetical protein